MNFLQNTRPHILSKRALLLVALLGLILLAALILNYFPKKLSRGSVNIFSKNSIQSSSTLFVINVASLSGQEQERSGLPLRLTIPVIKVDALIEHVGLTPDGAMDVPKGPDEAVWFNLGPRPGENGSAVIAGHNGWKNNRPAIFDNLHKLQIGDEMTVEDENGLITTFVVREIRTYGKDEAAPDVFGSSDGKPHLNLITCMGDWNNAEKTFSNRLIVFADKQ